MNEPSRQIHLDFHTSEHIPDVGKYFSKEQFKEAHKLGILIKLIFLENVIIVGVIIQQK